MSNLPDRFDTVDELEEFMTRPSQPLIADLAKTPGDILVLGVGGKMGPTLARMAKRAAPAKRVAVVAGPDERDDAQGKPMTVCFLHTSDQAAEDRPRRSRRCDKTGEGRAQRGEAKASDRPRAKIDAP